HDNGQHGEVEHWRRGHGRPFQRTSVPGIAREVPPFCPATNRDPKLRDLQCDAAQEDENAHLRDQHPRVPLGPVIVLHTPCHALETHYVERHEGKVEADEPTPERGFSEPLIEHEPESLGEPVRIAGEDTEYHTTDDHVVKVRHQEQAVVKHEVRHRRGQQYAGYAADDEGHHEPDGPQHWGAEADTAAIHGEEP